MKEIELAQDVVDYLKDYDLYFEVLDVDIIAKMGDILTAVEVKTTLNFKVIEQAFNNKNLCHYSYIAVPHGKKRQFQYKICEDYGIGVIELYYSPYNGKLNNVQENVKPKLNRSPWKIDRIKLTEEDKKSIPGASGRDGTTRSAFVLTVEAIKRYLLRHPGSTYENLWENIPMHWGSLSSMKSCVYRYVQNDIIKGVSIDNGKLYFSVKDDPTWNTKELY